MVWATYPKNQLTNLSESLLSSFSFFFFDGVVELIVPKEEAAAKRRNGEEKKKGVFGDRFELRNRITARRQFNRQRVSASSNL
uniref:Uncharacterized protein MANES_18G041200 n=1 Tax=Rhizophora mucronata TaxID=61149 RepID=A0A2P2PNP3_RHIMU